MIILGSKLQLGLGLSTSSVFYIVALASHIHRPIQQ